MKRSTLKANPKYMYIWIHQRKDSPISLADLYCAQSIRYLFVCIRIRVPEDAVIYSYDDFIYAMDDSRSMEQLGYDVIVRVNGRWKVRNDLKHLESNDVLKLLSKEYHIVDGMGYLTPKQFEKRRDRMREILSILKKDPGGAEVLPEYRNMHIVCWTIKGTGRMEFHPFYFDHGAKEYCEYLNRNSNLYGDVFTVCAKNCREGN